MPPTRKNKLSNSSIDQKIRFLEDIEKLQSPILDKSLGFLLDVTNAKLKIEMLRRFKENGYDITPEQWIVLNSIREREGVCQRELADLTFKDKPTITRILDLLVKKQLIRRETDSKDRRIFKIW